MHGGIELIVIVRIVRHEVKLIPQLEESHLRHL